MHLFRWSPVPVWAAAGIMLPLCCIAMCGSAAMSQKLQAQAQANMVQMQQARTCRGHSILSIRLHPTGLALGGPVGRLAPLLLASRRARCEKDPCFHRPVGLISFTCITGTGTSSCAGRSSRRSSQWWCCPPHWRPCRLPHDDRRWGYGNATRLSHQVTRATKKKVPGMCDAHGQTNWAYNEHQEQDLGVFQPRSARRLTTRRLIYLLDRYGLPAQAP